MECPKICANLIFFFHFFSVREGKPPIWSLGSDGEHYLHFPTTPKHNEFLQWSISVSSDNEDDENWLAEKEFKDWVLVKASESQDIRLDNNWGLDNKNINFNTFLTIFSGN